MKTKTYGTSLGKWRRPLEYFVAIFFVIAFIAPGILWMVNHNKITVLSLLSLLPGLFYLVLFITNRKYLPIITGISGVNGIGNNQDTKELYKYNPALARRNDDLKFGVELLNFIFKRKYRVFLAIVILIIILYAYIIN